MTTHDEASRAYLLQLLKNHGIDPSFLDDYGNRLASAIDANTHGINSEGQLAYTSHPGVIDSLAGLGNYLAPILHGGASLNRKAGLKFHAGMEDQVADWVNNHLPDIVKNAPDRMDLLHEMSREKHGLDKSQGFIQNSAETLGDMLTQIPLGAAKGAETVAAKGIKAIPEYIGPFIHPSVGNYSSGAVGGAAISQIPDWVQSLQQLKAKYPTVDPENSNLEGMAAGGAFDSGNPLGGIVGIGGPDVSSIPMVTSVLPGPPNSSPQDFSTDWYNQYGLNPEHNWGAIQPGPGASVTGYATNPSGTPSNGGAGSNPSLSDMLGYLKGAKNLYGQGKDLYHQIFGNQSTSDPSTISTTTSGTTPLGSDYQGTSQGGVNSQSSNPSSGGSGSGSLSNLVNGVGSGLASGTIGSTLGSSTIPQGVVEIGEVGDTSLPEIAGSSAGSGALDAGIASGLSDAAASTAVQEGGSSAVGSVGGSVGVGSTLGAVGAIAAMLNSMFGPEAYGSHSISGGAPLPGQKVVSLPGSSQTALSAGDLARGYGNNASQGSGQWFYTGDTKGADGWLGRAGTEELTGGLKQYTGAIQAIQDAQKGNSLVKNPDGSYSTTWADGNAANLPGVNLDSTGNGTLPGIQQRYVVNPDLSISVQEQFDPSANTQIIDNPNPGTFGGNHVWAANDPSSGNIVYNPTAADYFANPDWNNQKIDLHDIYNQYGGQSGNDKYGGWGSDYNTWLSNALGVLGNMSGEESGSYTGHADGGYIDDGYADGGRVKKLMEFLENISVNPHASTNSAIHHLEDPIENIKYGAYEAKQRGKLSPDDHAAFSDLINRYANGSNEVTDDQAIDGILNLHGSLFGGNTGLGSYARQETVIPPPFKSPTDAPFAPYGLNKTR